MTKETAIKLFNDKKIRTHWDEEQEKWYFSIVDVVGVLTESVDVAAYWRKLKQRLKAEGNETVTNCHGLKIKVKMGKCKVEEIKLMAKKKNNEINIRSSAAEYLTFIAATGDDPQSFEMRYEEENVWLTQKMLATLYDVSVSAINQHIKKIFNDNELESSSVIKKYLITATDGKQYNTIHYNLQMIISVGFKVNNERAVQFRKWASQIVKDYTIKGFAMDDERLKNGGTILTEQYFEEQLQRVREIRLSERKFYQKITDIYTTAIDYDVNAGATKRFFATVQNKLHWAIHGQTASEVIYTRADAEKEHMGLITWKGDSRNI